MPGGVVPHPVQGPQEHGAAQLALVVGLPVVVQLTVRLLSKSVCYAGKEMRDSAHEEFIFIVSNGFPSIYQIYPQLIEFFKEQFNNLHLRKIGA